MFFISLASNPVMISLFSWETLCCLIGSAVNLTIEGITVSSTLDEVLRPDLFINLATQDQDKAPRG